MKLKSISLSILVLTLSPVSQAGANSKILEFVPISKAGSDEMVQIRVCDQDGKNCVVKGRQNGYSLDKAKDLATKYAVDAASSTGGAVGFVVLAAPAALMGGIVGFGAPFALAPAGLMGGGLGGFILGQKLHSSAVDNAKNNPSPLNLTLAAVSSAAPITLGLAGGAGGAAVGMLGVGISETVSVYSGAVAGAGTALVFAGKKSIETSHNISESSQLGKFASLKSVSSNSADQLADQIILSLDNADNEYHEKTWIADSSSKTGARSIAGSPPSSVVNSALH